MKKYILFFLISLSFITICSSLYAQKRVITMQDLLESKNWNLSKELSRDFNFITQFEGHLMYSSMLYQGKREWISNYYYFSDQIDRTFHKEKIGKETRGKYLIIQGGDKNYNTTVFEFITLTSDSLVLKRCFDPSNLVIDAPPVIVYSSSKKKKR